MKIRKVSSLYFLFLILFAMTLTSCTMLQQPQKGKIVMQITFPSATRSIPAGTSYIEVTLNRYGDSAWTCKEVTGLPGETVEIEFSVPEGTYTIQALTAKPHTGSSVYKVITGYKEVKNVGVTADKITTVHMQIEPVEYDYSESPTEGYEGDSVRFTVYMTGPKSLMEEIKNEFLGGYMKGTLADKANDDYIKFTKTITETTDATATLKFYSESVVLPQVDTTTNMSWYVILNVDNDKWKKYRFATENKYITVKNHSGNLVIIIE